MTDDQVAVGGRAGPGHEVAAAALRDPLARRVPDLLDRAGEEGERVDAGRLGAAVELLHQPGEAAVR